MKILKIQEKRSDRRYKPIRVINCATDEEEITTLAWQDLLDEMQYGQAELIRAAREEIRKRPAFEAYLNDWRA